jgi:tRNA U34 5-carboxymethylaminomethyl modifying GTPase MnmE/TrmE
MRAKDVKQPKDRFGVKTPSVEEIARKHHVSVEQIKQELQKGMEVELEHTDDEDMADEIARDHLDELPDYYTRLAKMEKRTSKMDVTHLTFRDVEDIIVHYAGVAGISEYELLDRLRKSFGNEE